VTTAGNLAIGVVGVGAMGSGVVGSLVRGGLRTLARDIRPEAQRQAAALGATVMPSPAALARAADIAILLVVDEGQIDEVLFGTEGAAAAFAAGASVILSSTVDPLYVRALAPRLAALGVALVDAPVSGGPAKAADATMTMMVSAAPEVRERCDPVLRRIAGRVFVVGDVPGDAATFKIVNNLLAAANLAAGAEALALAAKAGIDPRRALDVVEASSGASWIVTDRMRRLLAGDRGVRAATKILAKDVAIAAALADRLGTNAPFARTAAQIFRDAVEAGLAETDDATMLEFFAAPDGATPRRA